MRIGDTFYWGEGGHLWIVISDPDTHDGEFIIVNLTKDVFRAGRECELDIGDHSWIKQRTYVSFGDAQKLGPKEAANLEKGISSGLIRRHLPMRSAVIQKITSAARKSKALPSDFVNYL
jgi:hypothetical protein